MSTALPAAPHTDAASAPVADAAPPAPLQRCENCGNEVSQRYCGACGQRLDSPVHSLWEFSQHAAEDLTHADSRLWRTLAALMFRPGELTREFLAGRRARYLPPLRLYLVLSVAFFLWAGLANPHLQAVRLDPHDLSATGTPLGQDQTTTAPDGTVTHSYVNETPQHRADRVCKDATYNGPWAATIGPLAPAACRRVLEDNGQHLAAAFLHNVPRAMFVFLPLLAAGMMLLYWRPRRLYIEHLLLFLHNHAFVFLLLLLAWLARRLVPPLGTLVGWATFFYLTWYVFRSMRVVYGQGRARTALKLAVMVLFYLVCGGLMLIATSLYTALTL